MEAIEVNAVFELLVSEEIDACWVDLRIGRAWRPMSL